MERTLEGLQNPGVHIIAGEKLVDLEYADDVVLLFDKEEDGQAFLDKLDSVVPSFGMRFAPEKCKVMLQNIQNLNPALVLQGLSLELVEHFSYLGSCLTFDGNVEDEVTARISKARVAFPNLRGVKKACHWN